MSRQLGINVPSGFSGGTKATSSKTSKYCMTVYLFGATESSVAYFCMKKTAMTTRQKYSDQAIDTLRRSFYVDDMLKPIATIAEAVSIVKEMQDLLKQGGFVLNKFSFTSRQVVQSIPQEDGAKSWQKTSSDSSLGSSGTSKQTLSWTRCRLQSASYSASRQVSTTRLDSSVSYQHRNRLIPT